MNSDIPEDELRSYMSSPGRLSRSDLQAQDSLVQPPQHQLVYSGRTGAVYKIWLLNLLLNIVTLGIYRFWGKTRMRRYIAGSFSLEGDTFEYLGNGKQLFLGFFKVLPILIIVSLPFFISGFYDENNIPLFVTAWTLISLLALGYLIPVARYMALRYRVSRTSWRGIRGYMSGSPWAYGRKALWWNFLNLITLNLIRPKFDMAKNRYKYSHIYAGNIRAEFRGEAKNIMKAHWISWGIALYFLVVAGLLFAIPVIWEAKGQPLEARSLMVFLSILSLLVGFPLARSYYQAALLQECLNNYSIGNLQIRTAVTFGKLMGFQFKNLLILIFTLGFGIPLIIQRKMKFVTDNVGLDGDPGAQEFMQAKNQKPDFAEGLDDALDIDSGLM